MNEWIKLKGSNRKDTRVHSAERNRQDGFVRTQVYIYVDKECKVNPKSNKKMGLGIMYLGAIILISSQLGYEKSLLMKFFLHSECNKK